MNLRSYGPGKFSLIIDKLLYSAFDPDDEISFDNGEGWYGLYRAPLLEDPFDPHLLPDERTFLELQAGAIMFERSDGIVEIDYYETDRELDEAWNSLQANLIRAEIDMLEARAFDGEILKVADLSEVPDEYIGEIMLVNDHGNVTHYVLHHGGTLEEIASYV